MTDMMHQTDTSPRNSGTSWSRCQCCGRVLERSRLRYCTRHCKDDFTFKLKWFNNLLRVLETRFATFSFTDTHLILNILPQSSNEVYTYVYDRLPGRKPAQDMSSMICSLGQMWWGHMDQTKSERRACRHILSSGQTKLVHQQGVKPSVHQGAATVGKQLRQLKLHKEDLLHPTQSEERLKKAFRQAALAHHPDTGGDSQAFRKVYAAYQDLLSWLQNPSFQTRRGVPGQWCYVGLRSTWLTPL